MGWLPERSFAHSADQYGADGERREITEYGNIRMVSPAVFCGFMLKNKQTTNKLALELKTARALSASMQMLGELRWNGKI